MRTRQSSPAVGRNAIDARTGLGWVACACVAMAACAPPAGCAGRRPPEARSADTPARTPEEPTLKPATIRAGAGRLTDPVAVSELRERAVEGIVELASHPEDQVRANTMEAISLTPGRAEPILAAGLKDPNLGVRSVAAICAGRAGLANLAPSIRPLLSDPSPFVRASAIFALQKLGDEIDPGPLAQMFLTDASTRVRSLAAFLLGELGNPSAVGLLHQGSREPAARSAAAESRLLALQIAEARVKLGDTSQLETIRAALYPSRPEELEATALAVQIIGQVRDHSATNEVIRLITTPDPMGRPMPAEIMLGSALTLAQLGQPKGDYIADAYATNPNAVLRAQAAAVYGYLGGPESLAKLEILIEDPEASVRVAALAAVVRASAPPSRQVTGAAP